VEKYLRLYAEPEVAALDGLPEARPGQPAWENVVVIPACNESAQFLRSPPRGEGRSLLILVINEAVTASQTVSENNRALAMAVQARFARVWQASGLSLFCDPLEARDVLLVDRYSEGRQLPAKGGVGFARKIGADLALGLIHRQRINSNWIHCTDADVILPETYFTFSNSLQNTAAKVSALIYPFSHRDRQDSAESNEVFAATQLYELSLRYYVAGMKFARSPYAFHTIGSTMAVSANHYAQVRGFPKREAGEDFYLLNKLAKVGTVLEPGLSAGNQAIGISARRSDRVPFGTGAAVSKITALADPLSDFRCYDPLVFQLLKTWLQSLPVIWASGSATLTLEVFSNQPENQGQMVQRQALLAGLQKIKTEQALEHAFRQSRDLHQFIRQMSTWFDAFRTLKLIHLLRESVLPSISYVELAAHPAYQYLLTKDPDLLAFHHQLSEYLALQPIDTKRHKAVDSGPNDYSSKDNSND